MKPAPCSLKRGILNARCLRCGYRVGTEAGAFARCWYADTEQTATEREADREAWQRLGARVA